MKQSWYSALYIGCVRIFHHFSLFVRDLNRINLRCVTSYSFSIYVFLQTSCCEHWLGLGMVCKQKGIMPCPCISVNYKLASEDFIRAGYVNYWNPRSLIVNYAVSEYLVCKHLRE